MAAPNITWRQHNSSTSVAGNDITTLSLGTVTANQWSANKCVSVYVGSNSKVSNLRLWLADSSAVVNGSPVSLGNASRRWDIRGKAVATVGGQVALFNGKGSMITSVGTTLATDYRTAPNNSLGAGLSLGAGVNNSVAVNTRSKAVFLSVKPHASAYDGQHTGFAFQVGYDFV